MLGHPIELFDRADRQRFRSVDEAREEFCTSLKDPHSAVRVPFEKQN
jgi:hypothetical protein